MRQPVCNRIDSYTVYDRITTIVENALAFYVLAAALTVDAQRSGYTLNQDLITCSHAGIAPLVVNTAKFLTHVTGDAVETTLASIDFPTSIVASHSPTILLPAPTADSTKHESSLTRSSQTEKKSKSTSSKKESTLGPVGLPSQNAIIPSVTNQNSMSTVTETKTVTASPLMVLVTLTESVTFYANTTCAAVNNRTWTPIEITVTPIDISRVTSSVGPGTAENLNSDSTLNMGSVILCQGGFGDSSACSAGPTVTSIGGDTSSQTIIAATGNNGSTVVVPWWLYVAVLMIGAWIHGLS